MRQGKGQLGLVLLCGLLAIASVSQARNTHGEPDPAREQQKWWGDALHGYVVSGCGHGTSATTSINVAPCYAYGHDSTARTLHYLEDASARTVTFSGGDGVYWLLAHASISATVEGWTRVPGTHLLWKLSATRPATPVQTVFLSRSIVASSVVTHAYDLRNGRAYTSDIDVTAPLYGAKGDGVTDDAAAFTAACQAVRGRWFGYQTTNDSANGQSQVLYFPSGRTYALSTTWTCELNMANQDNLQIIVMAHGATFKWLDDTPGATMIDFSPNTLCTDAAGAGLWGSPFVRKLYWHGGFFQGPVVGGRIGNMMKAYGIRGFDITDTTAHNFHTILNACVQNSFTVENNKWTTYVYALRIDDTDVDETAAASASSGQSSTHTRIVGNTFSAGAVTDTQCHTILSFISGAWQALTITENSFQGRCSNAWVDLQTGESNTRDTQSINIAYNTFEQAESTEEDPSYGIRIRTRAAATKSVIGVTLIGNELRFGSTTGFRAVELIGTWGVTILSNFIEPGGSSTDWVGFQLNDVRNVRADANHFERGSQEEGEVGTCWKLLGTANNNVNLGNFSCSGVTLAVDDNVYDERERHRYTLGNGIRYLSIGTNKRWTDMIGEPAGLNGGSAVSSGNTVIDMDHASNLDAGFAGGYNGAAPRGYLMRIQIRDDNSDPGASAGALPNPGIWLASAAQILIDDVLTDTPLADRLMCSAAGLTDNTWASCDGYVDADENGDIYAEWLASGSGTLTIRLVVLAIYD